MALIGASQSRKISALQVFPRQQQVGSNNEDLLIVYPINHRMLRLYRCEDQISRRSYRAWVCMHGHVYPTTQRLRHQPKVWSTWHAIF